MFLRCTSRKQSGKEHRYWSLVENKRVGRGRVVQRHVLYLGEINDSQQETWRKSIEIFEEDKIRPRTVALFPEERMGPVDDQSIVRVRLSGMELRRPRQMGRMLAELPTLRETGIGRFLGDAFAAQSEGDSLGSDIADVGLLPAHRAWQRMAFASGLV